ncbi:endonuclease/exonuclease/phosphatase family metal-dependent hydrolase [Streptomyces filamentosus]
MRLTRLLAGALAGGIGLLGLPSTATAVTPATAPPDMTVISWNICGEAGDPRGKPGYCPYRRLTRNADGEVTGNENILKAQEIARLVEERNADAIVLQEVCGTPTGLPAHLGPGLHQEELQRALANEDGTTEWSFHFAGFRRWNDTTPESAAWGSACRGEAFGDGTKGRLGNLIAVKGEIRAADSVNTVPTTVPAVDSTVSPVQCVALEGKSVGVCNTHIMAKTYAEDPRVKGQIENVKAFVEDFKTDHGLEYVALGGDFNRPIEQVAVMAEGQVPQQVLGPLTQDYEHCVNSTTHHGWSDTDQHTWHEYDQIFVTRRSEGSAFSSCDVDVSRMDTSPNEENVPVTGWSDHAPVIARLGGTRAAGDLSGDGKPDLVAIDSTGKLRLYHGNGRGGTAVYWKNGLTANYEEIGSGGWLGASVSHRGDWTGDGLEDIVARVGTQLRVYPGRTTGSRLASPTVVSEGLPTDAQVVSAGDMTGDGHPDLVVSADGRLWLYKNDWSARPAVAPRVEIKSDGWPPMTITAPGDVDKDGRPDLLVRDTDTGDLHLYEGSTLFATHKRVGWAFTTTGRPLIAGAADADLDGTADMWATTKTGTLVFYSSLSSGTHTVVGQSGWNTITAIS